MNDPGSIFMNKCSIKRGVGWCPPPLFIDSIYFHPQNQLGSLGIPCLDPLHGFTYTLHGSTYTHHGSIDPFHGFRKSFCPSITSYLASKRKAHSRQIPLSSR